MNKKHFLPAFIIFATILLASCKSQYVTYSVNNVTLPPETAKTIPINVNVKILTDNRSKDKENKILFSSSRAEVSIKGKKMCINAEKKYKKEPVANLITQLWVRHFNKAKLFANASYNDEAGNDYYLLGTLNSFSGRQAVSYAAGDAEALIIAATLVFGAIGGAIAGGIVGGKYQSSGKIVIEIYDLKLFKNDGTLSKDFGNFHKEYTGNFPVDPRCKCIYENVNTKLKEFNTELIEKIRNELIGVNF